MQSEKSERGTPLPRAAPALARAPDSHAGYSAECVFFFRDKIAITVLNLFQTNANRRKDSNNRINLDEEWV